MEETGWTNGLFFPMSNRFNSLRTVLKVKDFPKDQSSGVIFFFHSADEGGGWVARLVFIWLCGCVWKREPDYHQSSWNSGLISAWQGPGFTRHTGPGYGSAGGDKHCCLCYAPLNNSISLVLRSATSWLAPSKLLLWLVSIRTDGHLNIGAASTYHALFSERARYGKLKSHNMVSTEQLSHICKPNWFWTTFILSLNESSVMQHIDVIKSLSTFIFYKQSCYDSDFN